MSNILQFLQDDNRANSIKRLAFGALVATYIALCIVPLWRGFTDAALYAFINSTQDKLMVMIEFIGAYILAENVAPMVQKSISRPT